VGKKMNLILSSLYGTFSLSETVPVVVQRFCLIGAAEYTTGVQNRLVGLLQGQPTPRGFQVFKDVPQNKLAKRTY